MEGARRDKGARRYATSVDQKALRCENAASRKEQSRQDCIHTEFRTGQSIPWAESRRGEAAWAQPGELAAEVPGGQGRELATIQKPNQMLTLTFSKITPQDCKGYI